MIDIFDLSSASNLIFFPTSWARWIDDIPRGTANNLEHTAGGMNKTGHPSGSPIWLNDTTREVLGQVIFCEKRGEERYVCSSSCPVSELCAGLSTILWFDEWEGIKHTLSDMNSLKGSWMKCNWVCPAFRPQGETFIKGRCMSITPLSSALRIYTAPSLDCLYIHIHPIAYHSSNYRILPISCDVWYRKKGPTASRISQFILPPFQSSQSFFHSSH